MDNGIDYVYSVICNSNEKISENVFIIFFSANTKTSSNHAPEMICPPNITSTECYREPNTHTPFSGTGNESMSMSDP